jgi:capsular polysaccharide biosynthesis protein
MSRPAGLPQDDVLRGGAGPMPWWHGSTAVEPPAVCGRWLSTYPPATGEARPRPDSDAVSLVTALTWYWHLALLVIVAASALGGLAGILLQPQPTAVAQIAVLDPRGNSVLRQGVTSEASFATYTEQRAVFAVSAGVLSQACDRVRAGGLACSTDALKDQVKSTVSDSGALIDISASAGTGQDAVRIADAVVAAYRDLTSKDLQAQVAAQQKAVDTAIRSLTHAVPNGLPGSVTNDAAASTMAQLQARVANAAVDASSALDGTRFVVAAQVVPDRTFSSFSRGVGIGAGIGILAAVILGYAWGERVPAPRSQLRHAVCDPQPFGGPETTAAEPSSPERNRTQTPPSDALPAEADDRNALRDLVADSPPDFAWDPLAGLIPDAFPQVETDQTAPDRDRPLPDPVTVPRESDEGGA